MIIAPTFNTKEEKSFLVLFCCVFLFFFFLEWGGKSVLSRQCWIKTEKYFTSKIKTETKNDARFSCTAYIQLHWFLSFPYIFWWLCSQHKTIKCRDATANFLVRFVVNHLGLWCNFVLIGYFAVHDHENAPPPTKKKFYNWLNRNQNKNKIDIAMSILIQPLGHRQIMSAFVFWENWKKKPTDWRRRNEKLSITIRRIGPQQLLANYK